MTEIYITHNGQTLTIHAWAVELCISPATLYSRYKKGLRGDELLSQSDRRWMNGETRLIERKSTPKNLPTSWRRKPHVPKSPRVASLMKQHRKEANAWRNMVHHCHNTDHKAYPQYGGKGIRVCDAWRGDFAQFLADVGPRPEGHYCLGRHDKSKDFTPDNVAWMPRKKTHGLMSARCANNPIINGERVCFETLAKQTGIHIATLRSRHRAGDTGDDLIRPADGRMHCGAYMKMPIWHFGQQTTLKQLSRDTGIEYKHLYQRHRGGLRDADLVAPVRFKRKKNNDTGE